MENIPSSVDHYQLRTMVSARVDPIDWSYHYSLGQYSLNGSYIV